MDEVTGGAVDAAELRKSYRSRAGEVRAPASTAAR
jgi:hypothetical protein